MIVLLIFGQVYIDVPPSFSGLRRMATSWGLGAVGG